MVPSASFIETQERRVSSEVPNSVFKKVALVFFYDKLKCYDQTQLAANLRLKQNDKETIQSFYPHSLSNLILICYDGDDRQEMIKNMIKAEAFCCFRQAAANGHLDVVKQNLTCYDGDDRQEMIKNTIKAEAFYCFRLAAANGHLDVVNLILICYDGEDRLEMIKNMIQAHGIYCFKEAARKGHWDVVKLVLFCYDGDDRQEIIKHMLHCFKEAASNGHLDVIKQILVCYGGDDRQENEEMTKKMIELPRQELFEAYRECSKWTIRY